METYATIKGQIVIPVELRRKYGIQACTKINIIDTGEAILLKPVTEESLKRLQGRLKGKGVLKSLLEERRVDAERE
ncbi:MAG TPA: AbrB/MazE/SpoVT family DNA-binding domain-containing protein [Anaerolineales bacterium]|nr:AbrB/MazE/SpoVT family DNA-binding domain-containing protein [Anaerolineales bacterium]